MRSSILLVDDHPVFLKGLRSLLEDEPDIKVVGEAGDGQPQGQSHPKKDIEIIETKLHAPSTTEDYVHRPRLVALLEKNRHLPLQNIIAPAGYGNSTPAGCWLEKQDWPSLWISLDKEDNDLHHSGSGSWDGPDSLSDLTESTHSKWKRGKK